MALSIMCNWCHISSVASRFSAFGLVELCLTWKLDQTKPELHCSDASCFSAFGLEGLCLTWKLDQTKPELHCSDASCFSAFDLEE